MSDRIIPRSQLGGQVGPMTPPQIHDAVCASCGYPLSLEWRHLGGQGSTAYLACHEPACHVTLIHRLSHADIAAYKEWRAELEAANAGYVRRLEADLPPPEPTQVQQLRWRIQDLEGACLNTAGELRLIAAGTGMIETSCYRTLLIDAAERLEGAVNG